MIGKRLLLGMIRIGLGWIFLWPFLDKLFGLGFATCRDTGTGVVTVMCERAWLSGGSPTVGFLTRATKGPFAEMFQALAGNTFVDWLFMAGLLGIGLALMLGILVRFASLMGVLMLVLMYVAALPPQNNPIIDDHIVYALMLLVFVVVPAGNYLGFGHMWSRVARHPWLQ